MAILNPSQHQLVAGALATDMLLNKKDADVRYIDYINFLKEQYPDMAPMGTISVKGTGPENTGVKNREKTGSSGGKDDDTDRIKKAVLTGNKASIVDYTKDEISSGRDANDILNKSLLPGINEVGKLFESGRYFLPQLIASAEAMRMSIEYLEPYLKSDESGVKPARIIIATVKGDIHDIGKNLVSLMLKNYGFEVYDLGKDVSKEEIIEKAREVDADIIALSALMTTTMQEMREVIKYARKVGVRAQVIVGGAVITQDYADEIEASGYSKDAQEAVKLARHLIEMCSSK
jgi:5-methyltetrahydrofolate--homocysteine methyltransferase